MSFGPGTRPVSGRLSIATALKESGQLALVSRCLSAAGLGFSGHPSPARDSAPLAIGLPAQTALDRDGIPRSAARHGRNGRPLYPGTCGAHADREMIPGPPPAALPRHGSYHPGTAVPHPELPVTRHQSRVHVLRPPGLPLTRGPRMTQGNPPAFPRAPHPALPRHHRSGSASACPAEGHSRIRYRGPPSRTRVSPGT
jgi:hypothetical protein